ncbi:MAG: MYXO-CTERM sorting domain-containing protein [Nannocystaceae bacterium]
MKSRILPALALLTGLTLAAQASAETTGPPPPSVYFSMPANMTEYDAAPVTIDVETIGSEMEEVLLELGLAVDGVDHETICEMVSPCTFADVTLEMGEHTLTARMRTNSKNYYTSIVVYVGVPAPDPTTDGTDSSTSDGTDGTDATDGDPTAGDTDTSSTAAGTDSEATDGATAGDDVPAKDGCACAATEGGSGQASLLLFGLLALLRRRR